MLVFNEPLNEAVRFHGYAARVGGVIFYGGNVRLNKYVFLDGRGFMAGRFILYTSYGDFFLMSAASTCLKFHLRDIQ